MKTTIFAILALLFLSSGSISAQEGHRVITQPRLLDFAQPDRDTLDFSKIRCIYDQYVATEITKNPKKKYINEPMLLQIGGKVSKYMSYTFFCTDSLTLDDIKNGNNVDILETLKSGRYKMGRDQIQLFKNFPSNKNTVQDRIGSGFYSYEENIAIPEWKIENDRDSTILGYSCIRATTTFHGRNYIAWFTPEIPISEGPWKLSGLPGLILRAIDDKKEVVFICTGIENVSWEDPIWDNQAKRKNGKTTKENFYKQLKRYCDNPSAFRNSTAVNSKPAAKIVYNPIELSE